MKTKYGLTISELVGTSRMTEAQMKSYGNCTFHLDKYPDTLSEELETFLRERGERISVRSLTADLTAFNTLGKVIYKYYPTISSFSELNQKDLEKTIRKWLVQNGKPMSYTREHRIKGKTERVLPPAIAFARRLLERYQPEDKTDVIVLDEIEAVLRTNPTIPTKTISLKKIPQKGIREEMKEIIPLRMMSVTVGTVLNDMQAMNHFTVFLAEDFPEIDSLTQITRDVISRYIRYLNNEEAGRKDKRKLYEGVKAVIRKAARLYEKHDLYYCFNSEDSFGHHDENKDPLSESEMERIAEAVEEIENSQIRRYFQLLMYTGARSGNLLLIRQDCIANRSKGTVLHIPKGKGKHDYEFPLDEEHERIVKECIDYSRKTHGTMRYVFADEEDPSMPMKEGKIKYQFKKLILDNDIRDDEGRPLKAETHAFRRTLGTRLANDGVDDVTISRLLGQTGTRSVKHYRKLAKKKMAEDTYEVRSKLDELYRKYLKEVIEHDEIQIYRDGKRKQEGK